MKNSLIKFVMLFCMIVIFSNLGCSQPKSDYQVSWSAVTGATSYIVLMWQGTDPAQCPFVEDQDYLSTGNNLSQYVLGNTTLLNYTMSQLPNNGEYIVAGVVSKSAAGFYSGLAKSAPFHKGTVPAKPTNISIIKL